MVHLKSLVDPESSILPLPELVAFTNGASTFSLISPEPGEPEHTRYVAIGASFLNGSTIPEYFLRGEWPSDEKRINFLAEYRTRVPETVIGNSIYVYRMEN